jgi:unsaturated rhamnogalacturonyl hydrolase
MNRRQMLKTTSLLVSTPSFENWKEIEAYQYWLANVSGGEAQLPKDKYIPFDWSFSEISNENGGIKLKWKAKNLDKKSLARLRITSATDVREAFVLEVKTTISNTKIADWDLQFAVYMQPFDLEIPKEMINEVLEEGISLKTIKGTKPFWIFTESGSSKNAPKAFLPHLLVYDNYDKNAWIDRILSLDSVQTFGWQQGIVWDGLYEMSKNSPKAKTVLKQQIDLFFGKESLVYAKYNNEKEVDKINGVESILPFAILAQTNPRHPMIKTASEFCEAHANSEGIIADGKGNNRLLKTEECYTVSYPLAVLAKTLNRPDLADLAIKTLHSRVNILEKGNSIYQRGTEQGELFFENWSRGVAWYLLGLAKSLVYLPESKERELLKTSFQKSVEKIVKYQQDNGLWYNFYHKPETGFETSGTAGIVAAINYGIENDLLNKTYFTVVRKAKKGLVPYLTPDGFLTGTSQVNKAEGGSQLQMNGFRIISPYTLGLLAHFNL